MRIHLQMWSFYPLYSHDSINIVHTPFIILLRHMHMLFVRVLFDNSWIRVNFPGKQTSHVIVLVLNYLVHDYNSIVSTFFTFCCYHRVKDNYANRRKGRNFCLAFKLPTVRQSHCQKFQKYCAGLHATNLMNLKCP